MNFLGKVVALGALMTNSIPVAPTVNAAAPADSADTVPDIDRTLSIGAPLTIHYQTSTNSSGTAELWPITAATPEKQKGPLTLSSIAEHLDETQASLLEALDRLYSSNGNSSADSANASVDEDRLRFIEALLNATNDMPTIDQGTFRWPTEPTSEPAKRSGATDDNSLIWIAKTLGISVTALMLCCGLNHMRGAIDQRVREAMQRGPGPGGLSGIAAQLVL